MASATYLIALGSNRRHGRHGRPADVVRAALDRIGKGKRGDVVAASRIVATAPIGPGTRRYANAAALIESPLTPPALLAHLKTIEAKFGRRRGRRWGDRVIDLDIIGWSGGIWASPGLTIPHPAFRDRDFVLVPLAEIAPRWRDPVTHLTMRQLRARLDRRRPRQ